MNNRKEFLRWLGTRKDLSAFERRMKIWKIDGIEKQKGIFSVSSVTVPKDIINLQLKIMTIIRKAIFLTVFAREILDSRFTGSQGSLKMSQV